VKVRYVGIHNKVEIAAIRQFVERGKTIDVPADVGRALVKQASWKKVATKKEAPSG
jgi:hypothetical protein